MKYLCVCDWGGVRSVAMAQYIKELNGKYINHKKAGSLKYEAIAIGEWVSSNVTMGYMIDWSDEIIDVRHYLPKDTWGNPRDPDLKKSIEKIWDENYK